MESLIYRYEVKVENNKGESKIGYVRYKCPGQNAENPLLKKSFCMSIADLARIVSDEKISKCHYAKNLKQRFMREQGFGLSYVEPMNNNRTDVRLNLYLSFDIEYFDLVWMTFAKMSYVNMDYLRTAVVQLKEQIKEGKHMKWNIRKEKAVYIPVKTNENDEKENNTGGKKRIKNLEQNIRWINSFLDHARVKFELPNYIKKHPVLDIKRVLIGQYYEDYLGIRHSAEIKYVLDNTIEKSKIEFEDNNSGKIIMIRTISKYFPISQEVVNLNKNMNVNTNTNTNTNVNETDKKVEEEPKPNESASASSSAKKEIDMTKFQKYKHIFVRKFRNKRNQKRGSMTFHLYQRGIFEELDALREHRPTANNIHFTKEKLALKYGSTGSLNDRGRTYGDDNGVFLHAFDLLNESDMLDGEKLFKVAFRKFRIGRKKEYLYKLLLIRRYLCLNDLPLKEQIRRVDICMFAEMVHTIHRSSFGSKYYRAHNYGYKIIPTIIKNNDGTISTFYEKELFTKKDLPTWRELFGDDAFEEPEKSNECNDNAKTEAVRNIMESVVQLLRK